MTVADDLATLRDYRPDDSRGFSQRRFDAALDRVEAEIARLEARVKFCPYCAGAFVPETEPYEGPCAGCRRAETAEAEVARLRDGLRRRNELIAKTIYNPPGWTGPDMWWADEARALLAEDGAPPIDAETWGLMQDGAAQPLPRSEYGGYMGGEPWGPDHPSYDEMGQ